MFGHVSSEGAISQRLACCTTFNIPNPHRADLARHDRLSRPLTRLDVRLEESASDDTSFFLPYLQPLRICRVRSHAVRPHPTRAASHTPRRACRGMPRTRRLASAGTGAPMASAASLAPEVFRAHQQCRDMCDRSWTEAHGVVCVCEKGSEMERAACHRSQLFRLKS